ncbi:peptidoglycan-binding domain-containing protein [uncultured Tateyamaria sp.]|uniref:peptidoglycan-binding domain-containing protein n=1 Tax=uncultured Tateyamaria sp. TaxID=455651 RepID=UPI00262F29EC|nr:peptidoglycan-binding domain-containing protein [uncultured Tateyamaria sp.]
MRLNIVTSAALAASLALVPATQASADRKDFIAGAILGGIGGAIIQNEVRKKRVQQAQQQRLRARTVAPKTYAARTYSAQPRTYTPKKTYRPSIPATQEGRDIQSSLNYFGFDAGSVDGRIGPATRTAVSDYQRYMGYPATGKLTSFQQHLLTTSYLRAEAGGSRTLQQIAGLPEGTRGLLKLYREDLASGGQQRDQFGTGPDQLSGSAYTDL